MQTILLQEHTTIIIYAYLQQSFFLTHNSLRFPDSTYFCYCRQFILIKYELHFGHISDCPNERIRFLSVLAIKSPRHTPLFWLLKCNFIFPLGNSCFRLYSKCHIWHREPLTCSLLHFVYVSRGFPLLSSQRATQCPLPFSERHPGSDFRDSSQTQPQHSTPCSVQTKLRCSAQPSP